jgi:hypothetical protein
LATSLILTNFNKVSISINNYLTCPCPSPYIILIIKKQVFLPLTQNTYTYFSELPSGEEVEYLVRRPVANIEGKKSGVVVELDADVVGGTGVLDRAPDGRFEVRVSRRRAGETEGAVDLKDLGPKKIGRIRLDSNTTQGKREGGTYIFNESIGFNSKTP